VDGCDSPPLEARLHALVPDNGAAWIDSIGRAGRRNDVVEVRKDLAAVAAARRFDTYWNTTIVHVTDAILKTHTMDSPIAFESTIGMVSALALPAYQSIVNACKGDALLDPDVLHTCQRVATVLRGGDTYLTEMIGIAIAKRAWPEGSAQYVDAVGAKRAAHYRTHAEGTRSPLGFTSSEDVTKHLRLMQSNAREQDVVLAELVGAGLNPDPAADWTDPWAG
jgi:hypothetical protein